MKEVYCKVNEAPIDKPPLTGRELWYKILDDKEYRIARSAWGFFLKAHRDECDIDGAIDTIAEGVLEIAEKYIDSATQ